MRGSRLGQSMIGPCHTPSTGDITIEVCCVAARGYRVAVHVRGFLFDRDGTLVHDVPHNGDPALVRAVPGARRALAAVRAAGGRLAVVTNQSGVARGLIRPNDVVAVHARLQRLLGPLPVHEFCPHGEEDGCACRKPRPALVHRAAARLDLTPGECVVIGDTGADMGAALGAGARAVLVPNEATLTEEIEAAPCVASSLWHAVRLVLDGDLDHPSSVPSNSRADEGI